MPSCAVTFSVTTDPAEADPEPGPYLRSDQCNGVCLSQTFVKGCVKENHATYGISVKPGEVGVAERRLAGREEVVRVGRGRRGRRGGVSRRHED